MNEHEVAFIIATNHALYYDECVKYISKLTVPEGYQVDIICISEANNMAEAYNLGMESSDAKYKVYMHQDVFILNQNFIGDLIGIFSTDTNVGLLGVIGGVALPQNAIIWNAWNIGHTYVCNFKCAFPIEEYQDKNSSFLPAEAVDGMLMATQYDIRWREDLNLGWDFYDVSQSLEFRRRGYKVGIPYQETPWCFHDCGFSNLTNYDNSRRNMLKEYPEFFSAPYVPYYDFKIWDMNVELFQYLKKLLNNGELFTAFELIQEISIDAVQNNNLINAYNILHIYFNEKTNSISTDNFFNDIHTWEQMILKYNEIKLLLMRLEADIFDEEEKKEYVSILKNSNLSRIAIQEVMKHSIYDSEKVEQILYQ
ncbi:MAG TPA: glycosyltransferase family protein [Lachnospiraceae bacterium]|nr:glycosyltransferase family protein [Lachnospiraceae bacterium]